MTTTTVAGTVLVLPSLAIVFVKSMQKNRNVVVTTAQSVAVDRFFHCGEKFGFRKNFLGVRHIIIIHLRYAS